jgi:hypothetical protein
MHQESSRTEQLCSPRIVKLEALLTMIFPAEQGVHFSQ